MQANAFARYPFVFNITTVFSLTSQITNRGENCMAGHRSVIGRSAKSMRRGARGIRLIVARTQSPDNGRPPCSTSGMTDHRMPGCWTLGWCASRPRRTSPQQARPERGNLKGSFSGRLAEIEPISANSLAAFIQRSGFRGSGAPWLCVRSSTWGWPGSLTPRTHADRHASVYHWMLMVSIDAQRPALALGRRPGPGVRGVMMA